MKKTKIKKRIISLTALLLCAVMLLSSCSSAEESGVRTVKNVESRNTITAECSETSAAHCSESAASFTEKAAASGLIGMFIDKKTNTFCISDSEKKHIWSVLPLLDGLTQNESRENDAAMATVKVVGGTDIYYLNTQDSTYGRMGYSLIENGAEFSYDLFINPETAAKQKYAVSDIAFNLKITVTLVDGSMTVGCTHTNLTGNPDACIESIELLNYFGAYNDSTVSDFLLVPDGCGAAVRTSIYDESFEALSFAVYGNDASCSEEVSGDAVIPAFGIKHGDAAFVSLIQNGDACASIHADKSKDFSDYNRVYPAFKITPVLYENETLYISKASFAEEITLCYRFLFGKNATYAGLASACREQLIRDSVLSTKTVDDASYLPFFLTLTGAVRKSFGPLKYLSRLTTFDQAQDMLTRMKNKGINNVNLRYTGVFSGGTDSNDIKNASLLLRLGGSGKLSELYEYVSTQKMSLYLDIDVLSSAGGFGSSAAADIRKNSTVYEPQNNISDSVGTPCAERELRKIGKLSKAVISVIRNTKNLHFSGYCVNDAGSVLYSDLSFDGMLRAQAAREIGSSIAPLSTSRSAMAVKGNFCILKSIDSIVNIPLETSVPESGAYQSVPFVQLVLHGIADYAGKPLNAGINLEETMLRCIEFGACPHFEWNYEPLSDDTENDVFYYDNTINSAAEFYAEANDALFDLRDARMTDHYEVTDGVFCTEYDTGAMIYVNYTDSDFQTMGVVVEARSFIRVN